MKLMTKIACALGLASIAASSAASTAANDASPATNDDVSFAEVIASLIDTTGIAMHSIARDTADALVNLLITAGYGIATGATASDNVFSCMTDGFDVRLLDSQTLGELKAILRSDDDGAGAELLHYAFANNTMFTVFGGDNQYAPYVSVEDRVAYDARTRAFDAAVAERRLAA